MITNSADIKTIFKAAAIGVAATSAAWWAPPGIAQSVPPGTTEFGVYDPYGDFASASQVGIEHLFLPWEDVFLPSLKEADDYAKERGRDLLVTIEPWTWSRDERNSPAVLRNGIASGAYDETMRTVCTALGEMDSPMTIRWAQEMEDKSGQFIWSNWRPQDYVSAYRRMNGICRAAAPNAKFMWSPLGFEGMEAFYPGDDVVDVVGLSVFGFQPWEEAIVGRPQSFNEILAPRYARAAAFGKPVMVAELGYTGDADYVAAWDQEVRQTGDSYPLLESVVYFNQQEVYPWPNGFGLPDWRRASNVLN